MELRLAFTESKLKRPDAISRSGLEGRNYDRIMKGDKIPSLEEFAAVSEALGVDGDVMLRRARARVAKMPAHTQRKSRAIDPRSAEIMDVLTKPRRVPKPKRARETGPDGESRRQA